MELKGYFVIIAIMILSISQTILITWSTKLGKVEFNETTVNFSVEVLKCAISLIALLKIWKSDNTSHDNKLNMPYDEVIVHSFPAALCFIHSLLQSSLFAYMDGRNNKSSKLLDTISTGVLSHLILKKKFKPMQWFAFFLLCAGCFCTQLDTPSDGKTSVQGWVMAIVMAFLSGLAGVYKEVVIKKHPSKNINVHNFWFSIFGMTFKLFAFFNKDLDDVISRGFFHGYSFITVCIILNDVLRGIAVLMVLKYADNIVMAYSTSVAVLLTTIASMFLFDYDLHVSFAVGFVAMSSSVLIYRMSSPPDSQLGHSEQRGVELTL